MKSFAIVLASLLLGSGIAFAAEKSADTGVAGVQKVIDMLSDMSAKCKQEKKRRRGGLRRVRHLVRDGVCED